MQYASPLEIRAMRESLKADHTPVMLVTDVNHMAGMLICVLEMYANPNVSDKDAHELLDLAKQLADFLETERSDVEPWIAMIFGIASLRRGGPSN